MAMAVWQVAALSIIATTVWQVAAQSIIATTVWQVAAILITIAVRQVAAKSHWLTRGMTTGAIHQALPMCDGHVDVCKHMDSYEHVCSHVYRHVCGDERDHVCSHVCSHVYRHVCRHAYTRDNTCV